MKASVKQKVGSEIFTLSILLIVLAASGLFVSYKVRATKLRISGQDLESRKAGKSAQRSEFKILETERAGHSKEEGQSLFTSELRVVAIGSAYPISYEAEICPFSNIPQPKMNQLDRDGDGITDDWELKHGLDKYDVADALTDLDKDGFSNLEEFLASTDPSDSAKHPPFVSKLRFVERKEVPFPYVFQGITKLSDGSTVFQLNTPADGKTHFVSIGDSLEGVFLQRFIPASEGGPARLFVMRDSSEVELVRGKVAADPESKAELINILDRSSIIATMGALLSLGNDEYTVLSVHFDKVVVKDRGTGKVYEIVGLADGEQ